MPCLSLIHILNMILLNNRIYGLTKGQYSPTSPRGFVSKSSPYGTVEDPFHPAALCFGARGRFFARAVATDAPGTVDILKAAMAHKGSSVCEILQNCVKMCIRDSYNSLQILLRQTKKGYIFA